MNPATDIPGLDLASLTAALVIDLVAVAVFAIGIYHRRHARPDLTLVFAFFNICLFVVITVIQTTEVAAALGFGLFAILSIIRLRSEPFDNREIGYFFGALVLGLLNGIGTQHIALTVALNAVVLAAIYVLDHPRVLRPVERRRVTLDAVYTDPVLLEQVLTTRLGAPVTDVTVRSIDYVTDSMALDVRLRPRPPVPVGPVAATAPATAVVPHLGPAPALSPAPGGNGIGRAVR